MIKEMDFTLQLFHIKNNFLFLVYILIDLINVLQKLAEVPLDKFVTSKIIDRQIANKLNYLLKNSVEGGTGLAASIEGRKIYGKTGTSDQNKDLWFIGSIKNLTTGIWIGFDDNRATNFSSGTSANFWRTYIKSINI